MSLKRKLVLGVLAVGLFVVFGRVFTEPVATALVAGLYVAVYGSRCGRKVC